MKLYFLPASPPAIAVRLLAKHLELNLELIEVNLLAGEHLSPEYMKISPFHTIPALDDNGFTLFESRAIMLYMLNKHAPESDLYPKDLKKRACVDAMLHFDNATLTNAFLRLVRPVLYKGIRPNPEEYERLHDCLTCFNNLLSTRQYAAGNELTIADISIIHSLVWIEVFDINIDDCEHLVKFMERVKEELPEYTEVSRPCLQGLNAFMKSKMPP